MRIAVWAGVFLLLFHADAGAAPARITVAGATADVQGGVRQVIVRFSVEIPADSGLDAQVLAAASYAVVEDVNPNGAVDPAVNRRVVVITSVEYLKIAGDVVRSRVVLTLASLGFGRGTVTVRRMTVGEHAIDGKTVSWAVGEYRDLSLASGNFTLKYPNETPVAEFNFSRTTGFRVTDGRASRRWFSLEGLVPLTRPSDVQGVPGAHDDASRVAVGFIQASFTQRTYSRGNTFTAYGVTLRTSGRLNGLEAVARYQAASFPREGIFLGAEIEAGYRDGRSEWLSLTQQSPDRGNLVARLGAVFEWAPQLGPINRDLGAGLRFFVRGRGWADYARNDAGAADVRFRGFLDTELFYNISTRYRAFVRYELGSLPPDLTRSVSTVMVGIGGSF